MSYGRYYYDELGRQDEPILLTLTMTAEGVAAAAGMSDAEKEAAAAAWKESCTPPLELVVQSRWPGAVVDWGDTEPLL